MYGAVVGGEGGFFDGFGEGGVWEVMNSGRSCWKDACESKTKPWRSGKERKCRGQSRKAVEGGIEATGMENAELKTQPKGDREKAKIARRLREETTMTWEWIAERVAMGARAYAANRVRALK